MPFLPPTQQRQSTEGKSTEGKFYHTSKILQTNKKARKINVVNAIPKTFKDVKFTADIQTFITLSTKNFRLMLAVHLRLNSLSVPL